jgi:hypothetical protein
LAAKPRHRARTRVSRGGKRVSVKCWHACGLFIVMLFWAVLARSEDKLPVLIVDGLLFQTGLFTVDVSTSPPENAPFSAWNAWNPAFARV